MSCPVHELPPSLQPWMGRKDRESRLQLPLCSTGAEMFQSRIPTRCCCATPAAAGPQPAQTKLLHGHCRPRAGWFLLPGQQLLLERARSWFCLIDLSWWAFHAFLIILPDICSQFVSNSSLRSSVADLGRRAETNSSCRARVRAARWGTLPLRPPRAQRGSSRLLLWGVQAGGTG